MNVWKIHAQLMQFVLIRLVAMIVNVNQVILEIHLQCAHQFRMVAKIQLIVLAVNQSPVH